jgi:hypothetical protein
MKVKLAVVAIGALVLMASEASARHHTSAARPVGHPRPTFGQSSGHVLRQTPQLYHQRTITTYPNPDRGPYPTPIPSWAKGPYSPGETEPD